MLTAVETLVAGAGQRDGPPSDHEPVNVAAVGTMSAPVDAGPGPPPTRCCTRLGVGAGCAGAGAAPFTTEKHRRRYAAGALPTMGVVLARPGREIDVALGRYDRRKLVHGAQSIRIEQPIPPVRTARVGVGDRRDL